MSESTPHDVLVYNIRKRIRDRKLRIGFLVSDNTKWNASDLVKKVEAHTRMECRIYHTLTGRDKDPQDRARNFKTEGKFFSSLGVPYTPLYCEDSNTRNPLPYEEIDVLFLQQPWGMERIVKEINGKILLCYFHYGYLVYLNPAYQYNRPKFHPHIWTYFEQSDAHKKLHIQHADALPHHQVVTGYPKLDVYLEPVNTENLPWPVDNSTKRVIYAPHHAFKNTKMRIATFEWNHDLLLSFAQQYPDISWVYRPHGRIKYTITGAGFMSLAEYEDYEDSWGRLENALFYPTGSYFDLFRKSDALITDSSSFLGEYLPTGKPVIWLKARKPNVKLNSIGKKITDTYYQVSTRDELLETFNRVIVDGDDYLLPSRHKIMNELFPPDRDSASNNIIQYLEEIFLD